MKHNFRSFVLRLFLTLVILCGLSVTAAEAQQRTAQPLKRINYVLSMSRPNSHLFEVSIEVEMNQSATEKYLDFQMPRWSPGRYAVFDFAKNVQEFRALSGICPPGATCKMTNADVTRLDNQTWRVDTNGKKSLTISYKVFGNDLSGTFSQLDERHANFNGGSIFMYIVDHKPDPVTLKINPPASWRIINARMTAENQREWRFPNYDLLIDTPTEIAPDWKMSEFKVDGKTYRVVVHSFGDEAGKRDEFVRDVEKIVRAETRMWGPPDFDSYTFLIHFAADDRSGDGMEHLNSTQIIEPGALADEGTYESALGTVSHEFFHVWNVKRLRPFELGPWDFTRPAATRGLWIAEGFTNYYGNLMMRRAGLVNDEQLLRGEWPSFSQTINYVEGLPGTRLMSAEEASLSAAFMDRSTHAQRTNLQNTSISYYLKGEVTALVLDLLIRGKTNGQRSLDDVMQRMYEEFYLRSPNNSYYLRGRGYKSEDFERVTSQVAGTDMSEFFRRYVRGVETLPYDEALAVVGLRLVRKVARLPYNAGITLDWNEHQAARIMSIRNESVAENAGLSQGDVILSINDEKVTPANWQTLLNRYKENDRLTVKVKRDRNMKTLTLTLGAPERFDYTIEEMPNASAQARALRAAWLRG